MIKIWKLRLSINKEIINKKKEQNDKMTEKIYCLNKNLDDLKINKVYIKQFLNGLWNYPEAVYNILLNTELPEVQTNLAPFIVNNFYCNHLSGN